MPQALGLFETSRAAQRDPRHCTPTASVALFLLLNVCSLMGNLPENLFNPLQWVAFALIVGFFAYQPVYPSFKAWMVEQGLPIEAAVACGIVIGLAMAMGGGILLLRENAAPNRTSMSRHT